MRIDEFKAWFEGFTEAMKGIPTKDQWTRIKARVAEVDGTPVTKTVYVDHYLRPYYGSYQGPFWGALGQLQQWNASSNVGEKSLGAQMTATTDFSSTNAMNALGKQEYSEFA